jgi:hypothetical protein
VRCIESEFPVWSVWQENQPDRAGGAVDPALGAQRVIVQRGPEGLALHCIPAADFRLVRELAAGLTLAASLGASGLAVANLPRVLRWLFTEGLVAELRLSAG